MRPTGWLCRDEAERARLLDMSARLRTAKRWSIALLAIAALVSIPVYGWAMQVPFVVAGVAVAVGELAMARTRRPERSSAAVFLIAQSSIVLAIALANGPRIYALPIFVFPALVVAPQLPRRVVAVGAGLTVLAMVGTALAFMPSAHRGHPAGARPSGRHGVGHRPAGRDDARRRGEVAPGGDRRSAHRPAQPDRPPGTGGGARRTISPGSTRLRSPSSSVTWTT